MKKTVCILFILILSCKYIYAQSANNKNVTCDLELITEVPYLPELSGDSIYWNMVIQGKSIIPSLIKNLSNIEMTLIPIPNYGKNYCIGDIAFSILCKIIHNIPIKEFILKNKSYPITEETTYLSFVNYNKRRNRSFLKKQINQCIVLSLFRPIKAIS